MKNTNLKKVLIGSLSLGVLGGLGLASEQAQAKHVHSYRTAIAKQSKQFNNVNKYLHWVHWYDDHHAHHFNGWKVRHINHYLKGLPKVEKKQLRHYLHITRKYSTLYYMTHRHEHRHATERKSKEIHKALLKYEEQSRKIYNHKHHAKHVHKHAKHHATVKVHKHHNRKLKKVNKKHKAVRHHHDDANNTNITPTYVPDVHSGDMSDGTSSTESSSDYLKNYFNNKDNTKSDDSFLNDISNPSFSETDNGKYYSWNHLKGIINSSDFQSGTEPDSEANKVAKTIEHNINHYSKSQISFLYNNYSVLTAASSKLGSVIKNGYDLNFLA